MVGIPERQDETTKIQDKDIEPTYDAVHVEHYNINDTIELYIK